MGYRPAERWNQNCCQLDDEHIRELFRRQCVDSATTALTIRFKRSEANRGRIGSFARDCHFYLHASESESKSRTILLPRHLLINKCSMLQPPRPPASISRAFSIFFTYPLHVLFQFQVKSRDFVANRKGRCSKGKFSESSSFADFHCRGGFLRSPTVTHSRFSSRPRIFTSEMV
jgi:hypothetical protein